MRSYSCKGYASVRHILTLAAASTLAWSAAVHADQLQNTAVNGSYSQLLAAGYIGLALGDGAGVNVGVVESDDAFANAFYAFGAAGVTSPGSTLPNGNSDLPGTKINFVQLPGGALPVGANAGMFPANAGTNGVNYMIGNHATEVPGVIIGQGIAAAADTGIATGANVEFAALDNLNLGQGAAGQQNAATQIQAVAQQAGTPVINMSWGFGTTKNPIATNGSSLVTQFVDFAATRYDTLMVVAGNEGNPGAPSDSYNSIDVASTGARGFLNNGAFTLSGTGAILNYGVASSYNTSNMTADVSPITGYGRLKTDIVAPGGDPGPGNTFTGTFNNLPVFGNQFQSTAGGQYEYSSTNMNGVDIYDQDSFTGGVTTQTNGFAADTNAPFVAQPPVNNPGANLGGADFVQSTTKAGTSFAAPLVSGASALLYEDYLLSPVGQGFSSDHRLMKAILLNGASHTYNGSPLMEADNATPWTRLPGKGVTPLLAGTTAAQFGGSNPTVQPGLDPQLGTGMLNVTASLANYDAGRQAPGLVNPVGWDLNTVPAGSAANTIVDAYTINVPVSGIFSATLCWDDPVSITANAGPGNTWQTTSTLARGILTDLDLYLFQLNPNGTLGNNIDYSTSDIDNVEYLYDNLLPGTYQIDVANAQYATPQDTIYGLAWSVPEPVGAYLLLPVTLALYRRRRNV